MKYETSKHIFRVQYFLSICLKGILDRCLNHDKSKLQNIEAEWFEKYTPKLKKLKFGTREYKKSLANLKPALDHHYAKNRHHPEHFKNGVNDMNLIDVIEMVCDWIAAVERSKDGDIFKSLDIQKKKLNLSQDLFSVIKNTIEFLKEQK